ncbi:MAG TPA: carboxypeptidase-like regulatory domain-containing protein, partial [Vicinamibacterales bacterium]|nr:carboxypeptidase-like regulatory domain-containing protein [Vicinamibacterales bacterium]
GIETAGSLVVLDHYATPPPASHTAYAIAYYPSASTLGTATTVDLADSEEKRNIDFVLRPVPTARVSGRVTGPAQSQTGLIVRLLPEGAEALGPGSEQATALVGRDGTFTMPRVPAGRYVLEATTTIAEYRTSGSALPTPPGLSGSVAFSTSLPWLPGDPLPGELRVYGPRTAGSYSARVPVIVGADDVADVEVALAPGGRISGRVVRDDGSPLPKALGIQTDSATGDPVLVASQPSVAVNADGTFSVDGLRPGLYFLRASGHPIRFLAAGGADYSTRPIEVRADTEIRDVLVTISTRVATISGVVNDTKGSIVREGAIILFPVDRSQWTNFGLRPSRIQSMTYFGSQGFQLPRVLAGEYYLVAVDPGVQDAWQDPRFLAAAAGVATRVSIDWGATSVQNLTLQQVIVK